MLEKIKNNRVIAKLPIPKPYYLWAMILFITHKSGLHQIGWFKSIWKGKGIDRQGNPLPWITYPMISFLESRLKPNMSVFEYGSGNSTMWWAKRTGQVVSIEYNEKWYKHIKDQLSKNSEIIFQPVGKEYVELILEQKRKFDIIMIDGRRRVDCAKIASKVLKDDGVIIWDNTNRDKYKSGIRFLEKQGFKHIDFVGMVPTSNNVSQTSVFYRGKNCLSI